MTGGAQLEVQPEEEGSFALAPTTAETPSALKLEAAERVAEHRRRRARMGVAAAVSQTAERSGSRRESQKSVAAAVAERYAQTPSYRAFLAQEAERASQQAAAAAEIALRNAQAVAAVQQELLAELDKWDAPQAFTASTAAVAVKDAVSKDRPVKQVSTAGLTVRLYEDLGRSADVLPTRNLRKPEVVNASEARALDDEIAFRQAPVFEDYRSGEPSTPLPANLLEFPRQLIATVKARPNLALGPLREESGPRSPQLRIFEVEPEQIATAPEPVSMAPEWCSIFLDAHVVTEAVEYPELPVPELLPSLLPPQTAPMQQRLMAGAVDCLLVLASFVASVAAFAWMAGPIVFAPALGIAAGALLVGLYLAYQLIFFTMSDQTPGMRYARIGLCTFSDENPTRRAMRKRVLAQVVAVAPMGLGLAWALLDEDRLGWHDRMSRMYQRAY